MRITNENPHILDFSQDEWQVFLDSHGYKIYRAKQIFQWLHQKNIFDVEKMSNLPGDIKTLLQENFSFPDIDNVSVVKSEIDDTAKLLFNNSGKTYESVWLPYKNRQSLCISVQSGCSLDCSFCATGKLKFMGNLSTGQILEQVYVAHILMQKDITNVVYMGMGEPFHNYDNTIQSASMLDSDDGLGLARKKITISTSGVFPGIRKFVNEQEPYSLAISMHAIDPEKRAKLMDVEKKYPLEEIISYLEKNLARMRKSQITIEYILLKDYNMTEKDAKLLAKTTKRLNAKVNLIPLNTQYQGLQRPDEDEIQVFWKLLYKRGVLAFNRNSPGIDIDGACGMLAAASTEFNKN